MVTLVRLSQNEKTPCTSGATSQLQRLKPRAPDRLEGMVLPTNVGACAGVWGAGGGEPHLADACHGVRDGHAGQAGASRKSVLHTRGHEYASASGP